MPGAWALELETLGSSPAKPGVSKSMLEFQRSTFGSKVNPILKDNFYLIFRLCLTL
jgi:hypothetical protein